MKKSFIAIFAAIIMLFSLVLPVLSLVKAQTATEPASNYVTSFGVLSSDNYALYPFATTSLNIGFSKYGELIGINATADQTVQSNWQGLQYDGRDPFCPAAVVPMTSWVNGWFMYINYIDPTMSTLGKADRVLFAMAIFSDGTAEGTDWQYTAAGPTTGVGGRQTNGTVVTDPLKILYDGPREFVAQAVNHIYDKQGSTTWPVLDLTITLIFDKVMKQVMLYKDVKLTIPKVHIYGAVDVQLSNREEYDLGPNPSYDSYVHYYREAGYTSYTGNIASQIAPWLDGTWTDQINLTADWVETQVDSSTSKTVFTLNPPSGYLQPNFLKIYVGGAFVDPTITPAPYTVNWGAKTVTFASPPLVTGTSVQIKFVYKYVFQSSLPFSTGWKVPSWNNQYDYAQVISSDGKFIAWDAMWPPTSSYTVDGILDFLHPLINTQVADMNYEPKQSPLIIGQWDFELELSQFPMERFVEVKGISDRHNGDDANAGGVATWSNGANVPDTEMLYQLATVFDPFDLYSAVENKVNTWVYYYTVTQSDYTFYQTNNYFEILLPHTPVNFATPWEGYNANAERVFVNGALQYPYRQLPTVGHTFSYELETNGVGNGYIFFVGPSYQFEYPTTLSAAVLTPGTVIKVIYNTNVWYGVSSTTLVGSTQQVNFGAGLTSIGWDINNGTWTDYLGVSHDVWADNSLDSGGSLLTFTPNAVAPSTNGTQVVNGLDVLEWSQNPFVVYKEDTFSTEAGTEYPSAPISIPTTVGTIVTKGLEVNWQMWYNPQDMVLFNEWLDVHIYGWDVDVTDSFQVTWTVFTAGTPGTNYTTITPIIGLNTENGPGEGQYGVQWLFQEKIPGRYEYGVVGTNAATVDSAGLSMITAAFKDKEVEYGIGATDMFNPLQANLIPWVMSDRVTSTTVTASDYYYKASPVIPADYRVGLMDDYCTTWQITGANLIGSGGPLANLLAYYANDFESAMYGLPQFTPTTLPNGASFANPWMGKIAPISAWNVGKPTNGYADTPTTGYAVISASEDLNQTKMFLVWGNYGRDTYYASQWFWQDGIQEFQNCTAFTGATSIVLMITYNSVGKPTLYTVVNILGTISENTAWNPWSDYPLGIPYNNAYSIPVATMTYAKKGGLHDP